MIDLEYVTLKNVNGGSGHSYALGEKVGDAIRKALVIISLIGIFV